ncbi:site-2 protease family protein [Deferribacteraceae bacterium V6Fe1]|nr:site-2 protease family protein [Deferribacteraceae bacterium V6Fe1]
MGFDINSFFRDLSIMALPFLFAITIHEASHGYAAYFLGDDTAKRYGRLSLNPIKHIDIFGLIFLFVTRLFGWAKPVPVDFGKLRNRKYGPAIVAFAGPLSNFLLAVISAILLHVLNLIHFSPIVIAKIIKPIVMMLFFSVQINIALGIFNLIPILPLDGGRILQSFLPLNAAYRYSQSERYGFLIIIFLLITNVIDNVIFPIINFFIRLLI